MSEDVAIRVRNVSKTFKLPHEKASSIKSIFLNPFKRRTFEKQQVLKNISFDVKKGEFFGIVGRNGSGKSTLLKLISQIYTPDEGSIEVNGKLVPFIELGVGFNPELTGRENVFLNGALLGFSRKEMEEMYDEIVEFAELERFMDQKLKNYSSGMQVRLAFSIAIRAKADILVLDEVLAVGDEAFQRKCYQYFARLKKERKTVILVTHDMDSVQRFCTKAILIKDGQIIEQGNTAKVTQKYIELNHPEARGMHPDDSKNKSETGLVGVKAKCVRDAKEGLINFDIKLTQKQPVDDPVVVLLLLNEAGQQVYRWASDEKVRKQLNLAKNNEIKLSIQDIFPVGTFTANIRIMKRDRTEDYINAFNVASFEIRNESASPWNVHWRPSEEFSISGLKK